MKHFSFLLSRQRENHQRPNIYTLYVTLLMFTLLLAGCQEEVNSVPPPVTPTKGYYVLNSGKLGNNDATLMYYDLETQAVSGCIFEAKNGKKIGDTGNDILIYGSKMYITATGSNVIYITTADGTLITSLQPLQNGKPEEPRYLAADGKYVYVTLYSGHVARIDTATNSIESKVKVGVKPEGIAVLNGKLYVTNSGDYLTAYDETVSVIDIPTFTVVKTITVVVNPTAIVSSGYGQLYLISSGNYADIKSTLQSITIDGEPQVKNMGKATEMVVCNNTLYTLYGEFGDPNVQYIAYNAKDGSIMSDKYKPDSIRITKPYKLSADPSNNRLIITNSDYQNNGDVYILSTVDGSLITHFDSKGVNPIKIIPVKL